MLIWFCLLFFWQQKLFLFLLLCFGHWELFCYFYCLGDLFDNMKDQARFYYLYNSFLALIFRVLLVTYLIWNAVNFLGQRESSDTALLIFSFFLMIEVFIYFKIGKSIPVNLTRRKERSSIFDYFTISAIKPFIDVGPLDTSINHLLKYKSVQFILNKADISFKEIKHFYAPK